MSLLIKQLLLLLTGKGLQGVNKADYRKVVNMDEQMPEGSWCCVAGAAVGFIGVAVLTGGLGVGPFIGTYLALGGGAAGLFGGGAD